ncbi:MAG TPA: MFS transporter [Burkholderiales bacterium]|nr:MFS transporter [Burkholderiales bacterium]
MNPRSGFAPGSSAWLAAMCASRVLSAAWIVAYSAVLPLVREDWGLSARDAGMIQGAFHLGYLASLFVVGFLADHFGAKRAFLAAGVAGFLSPIAFALFVDGFWSALWLHALTGLTQGSYYTPVLAIVNEHVAHERRGRAMGLMIAASSAGYALALGAAGLVVSHAGWRAALGVVAAMPLVAWLIAFVTLGATPNIVHPRPAGHTLAKSIPAVLRNRRGMLSVWGYTFHSWELLGLWAWMPAFLTAALTASGTAPAQAAALGVLLAALTYVANIGGSIAGGVMSDRWGRTQTILLWSCASLALTSSIGWLIALPVTLLVAIACLLNFSAIADSSVHSTVIAESVPPHILGAAYAVRSVVGFGTGVVSPVVFGWALDFAGGGRSSGDAFAWGLAWTTLALGGLLGPLATWRLHRDLQRR